MKRILFLLCVLMLACSSSLADNFLLDQTLTMLRLTREKAALAEVYMTDTAAAEHIAEAIGGEVASISLLCFDNAGAYVRFLELSGGDFSGVSEELAAVLDASVPGALITMVQSMIGTQEVATAGILTVAGVSAPQDTAADALAVIDFDTDYVLACTYTVSPDGAVSCAARPVSRTANVLETFCAFYGLTEADVQIFNGKALMN